jgi:hypothetical protein
VARTMLGRQQRLEFQDPPVGGEATSCKLHYAIVFAQYY